MNTRALDYNVMLQPLPIGVCFSVMKDLLMGSLGSPLEPGRGMP